MSVQPTATARRAPVLPVGVVVGASVLASAPLLTELGAMSPGRVRDGVFSYPEHSCAGPNAPADALASAHDFVTDAPQGTELPPIIAVLAEAELGPLFQVTAQPFRLMSDLRLVNVLAVALGPAALSDLRALSSTVIAAEGAPPTEMAEWLTRTVATTVRLAGRPRHTGRPVRAPALPAGARLCRT